MTKYKAIVIKIKCKKCGYEHSELLPLEISEADWQRARVKYGEMVVEINEVN